VVRVASYWNSAVYLIAAVYYFNVYKFFSTILSSSISLKTLVITVLKPVISLKIIFISVFIIIMIYLIEVLLAI
jgi:hypothetical protein